VSEANTIPAVTVVVTREDVTVELLCFEQALSALGDRRRAGKLWSYVQATLEANPGLAARGILLPLGTRVSLPLFRIETAASNSRKPWDGAT
jgi:phage tail protein X